MDGLFYAYSVKKGAVCHPSGLVLAGVGEGLKGLSVLFYNIHYVK